MFIWFQSGINKLRANKGVEDHLPSDHEQALKLLHTLDPKVWASTAMAIVEGSLYETLTVAQLFSKLKASEVDKQLWSAPSNGVGSKSLALTSAEGARANSSDSFALSSVSLMSILEEQCWRFLCLKNINYSTSTRNHRCSTSPWSIPGYRIFPRGSNGKDNLNRMNFAKSITK